MVIEALKLYQDFEINEVISENPINRFKNQETKDSGSDKIISELPKTPATTKTEIAPIISNNNVTKYE